MSSDKKTATCLWYDGTAEQAAEFYVSLFPGSKIDYAARSDDDWPGGKAGDVILVGFTLAGQPYQAMNGGPGQPFNFSASISVSCRDQAEVDRYWEALTADGGEPIQCGWLKDRYGLYWQIVPEVFFGMMLDDDKDKRQRAMHAMMQMVKFDIAALEAAYDG